MDKKITQLQVKQLAEEFDLDYAAIMAVIEVEGSGKGYDPDTNKILIQFEPHWFKKKCDDWEDHLGKGIWAKNGIQVQSEEWKAFNDAFTEDQEAAMLSTSIGIMQVMGFNHKAAGFATVGAMYDAFKESEYNQVKGALNFIKSNSKMYNALKTKNWDIFAGCYNGTGYKALAVKNKTVPYDLKLSKAFTKFSK